jgi:hypothetical protein
MAKSVKLKIEEELGLLVYGIISQENDLKVSWAINKGLGMKLSRIENVKHPKSAVTEGFPAYLYDDEKNYMRYLLILNKVQGVSFLTSLRNVDFLMVLKGHVNENLDFVPKMKHIAEITGIIEIDASKLKERDMIPAF